MKYIKIHMSFGDKLKLLFFGLISEDKLPKKEEVRIVHMDNNIDNTSQTTTSKVINREDEEKFHVPFFDLNSDDVNSNF